MTESPSVRIAAELRGRIERGELRPGERVPSAREITRNFGVAVATASRVLAALRDDGLVHAVPGVGTLVSAPAGQAVGAPGRRTTGPAPAAAGRPTAHGPAGRGGRAPGGHAGGAAGRPAPVVAGRPA